MNDLFTARASSATAAPIALPAGNSAGYDIQWIPPGYQEPVCFVNGQPRQLKFTCRAEHAGKLNAQLQKLLSVAEAGNGDKPYTDYNHEDNEASSRPVRMYWAGNDPKKGGIRLVGKWTSKARTAISDGEWSRFSPQWEFDPATEEPTSVGTNLGGLVNNAAFNGIQAVARKAGSAAAPVAAGSVPESDGFIAQAKAHSAGRNLSDADTIIAFARTPEGSRLYQQYAKTMRK